MRAASLLNRNKSFSSEEEGDLAAYRNSISDAFAACTACSRHQQVAKSACSPHQQHLSMKPKACKGES